MDSSHSTTRPIAIECTDSEDNTLVAEYNMSEPSQEFEHLSRLARGAKIASELSLESLGVAIGRVKTLANERESYDDC